ncbi:hypothetical protein [Muricomes intestini]|jgi:hypothetical protein|uniref:Uncharacterized protein n=1 Tax=Muricomes intestini TaxID=1796634 RepID=A0A4R3K1Z9_9FIRM|nr:hypothetical protein [Muricomes intestini]TCS76001.1 hypothetical protein EDD59_12641 [Muricomes intestini]HAX53623.1 hypothetical protein [Lachnospiraceae bacterium]HCR83441.1 hypothetical protein [Lachnospiraceae bacterium]
MYEGNPVDLQMEKVISADVIFDDTARHCQVFKYDLEDDYIYLQLKEDDLTAISLDAKYQCYVSTKKELLYCTGSVRERFQSEHGNMIVFKIENGFYNVSEIKRPVKRKFGADL